MKLSETRHYDKNRCYRIDGRIFNSKEAAEQHGLKLCKDWIDNGLDRSPTRRYSFR